MQSAQPASPEPHEVSEVPVTQMPCASEIDFLRDALPDASVERVAHMLGGQHRCAYRIAPVA